MNPKTKKAAESAMPRTTATDPTIGFAPVASVNTDVVKKIALVVSSPLQCVDVKSGGYNGVCV